MNLESLKKKHKEYNRNSEQFGAVLSFLYQYSSGDMKLNDDLKYLFRMCGGQPIQDILYNTLIYDIHAEKWDQYSDLERFEILINKAAELYYYQRKLNQCIGRTFYVSYIMDKTLLWHIKNEISNRLDFTKEAFELMENEGFDYFENTFSRYRDIYLENYELDHENKPNDTKKFEKEVQKYYRSNKEKRNRFIRDDKTFWLAVTTTRIKSQVTLFTKEMQDIYGRRLYPTKDDLFVFAIAMQLSYDDFVNLVNCAVSDYGDSARYAYNTANLRDALILSVIRNIDEWYETTSQILEETAKKENRVAPKENNSRFPMEVLFRVDKMLWDNLCSHETGSSLEKLLYHSFLIDRGDRLYARKYREWEAAQKKRKKENEEQNTEFIPETIIDFQTGVKEELQKARLKAKYGNQYIDKIME